MKLYPKLRRSGLEGPGGMSQNAALSRTVAVEARVAEKLRFGTVPGVR